MNRLLTFTVGLAVLFSSQGGQAAAVLSTGLGNGADAYGNVSHATSYGASPHIGVKHNSNRDNHRIAYFRFDLAQAPTTIIGAALEMTFLESSDFRSRTPKQYVVYGLDDGHPGEQWDEATLTWSNAPARSDVWPAPAANPTEASVLGFFTIDNASAQEGDRISFSSDQLLSFLSSDTDGLVTLILARTTKDFGVEVFASKEHGSYPAPALVLATPVPLPPAAGLLTIPVLLCVRGGVRSGSR